MDFSEYLNGNPAMLEIWREIQERIDGGIPLSQVQWVVAREWLARASVARWKLEDRSAKGMMPDEKYQELQELREMIERIRKHAT